MRMYGSETEKEVKQDLRTPDIKWEDEETDWKGGDITCRATTAV